VATVRPVAVGVVIEWTSPTLLVGRSNWLVADQGQTVWTIAATNGCSLGTRRVEESALPLMVS
jgi:hypothetical protein